MPRLLPYSRQVRPAQPGQLRAENIRSFGGSGQGMMEAGRAIVGLGEEIDRRKNARDATKVATSLVQAETQWRQRLRELESEADLGAPGFTDQVRAEYQQFQQQFLENFGNMAPENVARLNMGLTQLNGGLVQNAIEFESRAQAAQTRLEIESTRDLLFNEVRAGNLTSDQAAMRFGAVMEAAEHIAPDVRVDLQRGFTSGVASSEIEQQISAASSTSQLAAIRERVEGMSETLSASDFDRALDQIDSAQERLIARGRAAANEAFRTAVALRAAGIETDFTLEDARQLGPDQARAFESAMAQGSFRRVARTMSLEDAERSIGDYDRRIETASSDQERAILLDERNAFVGAFQEELDVLERDPPAYMIRNLPFVERAYETWSQAEMLANNNPDDESLRAAANARREEYLEITVGEQIARGIENPRILTGAELNQIQGSIYQASRLDADSGSADNLIGELDSLQSRYGDRWNTIKQELMDADALPPGIMQAVDLFEINPPVATRLMSLRTQAGDVVNDDNRSDINDALAANAEVQDMLATLRASGDYTEAENLRENVSLLMADEMAGGATPAEAAERAAGMIVSGRFELLDTMPGSLPLSSGSNPVRFPTTVEGVAVSPATLNQGIAAIRMRPDILTELVGPVQTIMGLTEEDVLASIGANGVMVNDPTGRGVNIEVNGVPLQDAQGRLLTVEWSQLRQAVTMGQQRAQERRDEARPR